MHVGPLIVFRKAPKLSTTSVNIPSQKNKDNQDLNHIKCYKYNKIRHFANKCPKLSKN